MVRFAGGACLMLEVNWNLRDPRDVVYLQVYGSKGAGILTPLQSTSRSKACLVNVTPALGKQKNYYKESYQARDRPLHPVRAQATHAAGVGQGRARRHAASWTRCTNRRRRAEKSSSAHDDRSMGREESRDEVFPGRILPPLPLILPSLLSGVLVTLCFPVVVAGAGVVLGADADVRGGAPLPARSQRTRFAPGFLMGSACFVSMLWWIVKLVPSADVTIPWLMTPALILLVLYLSFYPAFHLLVLSALTRWRLVPFLLAAPATWALFEVARSRGELAFPWGLLGYSLSNHPSLLQTAEVWGVFGLSFVIVAVNALAAGSVAARGPRAKAWCGLLAGLVAGAMWLYGDMRMKRDEGPSAPTLRVAVAQPNIDLAIKWKPEFKDSSLRA